MSLLRDIQNAAIDTNTDLTSLLRKCKVLAVRLGSEEFKSWIDGELSGYKSVDALPEYRALQVNSKGHFSAGFGSALTHADIPLMCIPEEARKVMSHFYNTLPVASIEALVKDCNEGSVREPWNPDFVALVGSRIYQGMNCLHAWKVIPVQALVGTLNEIRNRVLSFALEIEAENPEAGEAALNSEPVPPAKLTQIFNRRILI